MDLLKAKIFLDKINREFSRMSKDPDNVARIDVDITLSYVRELYDAFLSDKSAAVEAPAPARKPAPAPPPVQAPPPPPPPVVEVAPAPAPPPPPVVVAPPAPVVVEAPPPPPPVVVVPPPPAPAPAPVPPPPAPAPVAVVVSAGEAEVLFEYKVAREVSEKLSDTAISDLKRAIAINDRMLLTRELFGGDAAAFEAALGALNGYSGFEQAKAYLISDVIGRFDWLHNSRAESAKSFIRLIRRRYK
jgi:hypothetical protein